MVGRVYKLVRSGALVSALATLVSLSLSCGGGSGESRAANASSDPSGPASINLSTSALSFANQPVAVTSSPSSVVLTNTGGSGLEINSISITGADARSFSQSSSCGSTLAGGQNCRIAVMFTPATCGSNSATLSIADNSSGSPHTVNLSGSGLHDVVLTWTPSTTGGLAGYIVLRSTGSAPNARALFSTPMTGTMYVDTDVQPGQTYQYWLTSVAAATLTQSAASSQATATIPSP